MRPKSIILLLLALLCVAQGVAKSVSTRDERRAITAGNKLVKDGKLAEAIKKYETALQSNPESAVAMFNIGLTQINLSRSVENNDSLSKKLMSTGTGYMQKVAQMGVDKRDLSSKANYNLGNVAFQNEDYAGAIRLYKQSLRLDPAFEDARRNLRIAQLKLQNNDNNQDQQNQENKPDQQPDQQQDQQQDRKDHQQDRQDQQEQQPPRENEINQQTAEQILNAVENNENQTRARKGNAQGEKASGQAGGSLRKW